MDLKVIPRSYRGHKYILCLLDEVTNYLITIPIHQAKSEEIGDALIENIITTISEKICACNGDKQQLYKPVSELASYIKENPPPIGKSNNDLAEEFADFFLLKIQQIHDSLEGYEKFSL